MSGIRIRLGSLALAYGAIAGAVALLTLQAMLALQSLLWAGPTPPWRIGATILAGGAVLFGLSYVAPSRSVAQLLVDDDGPSQGTRRAVLVTAAGAVVAVAFGGAVGPEAGLLAVVRQLSTLVSARIAMDRQDAARLNAAARAAALGGLYASPPAAAALEGDELGRGRVLSLGAALAGFVSFVGLSRLLFNGNGVATIELPRDGGAIGMTALAVVLAGIAGAALGVCFRWLHGRAEALASRLGERISLLLGTAFFAVLATVVPVVRFSGHHEIGAVTGLALSGAGWQLALLAVAKLVALVACLASGWRGGEIFPLIFIGAAVGGAVAVAVPGAGIGAGIAAGMAGAAAVGWGRPLAAFLLLVLVVEGPVALPVAVGVGIGFLTRALLSSPPESFVNGSGREGDTPTATVG